MIKRSNINPEYSGQISKFFRRYLLKIIGVLFCFYVLFILGKSLYFSSFFQKRDRINVVFYGKESMIYSFGINDGVHYAMYLYPDLEVVVPGGFGLYRVGALGKLVELEKDQAIFRNTFSLATSSFIDFYFYPKDESKTTEIYFGRDFDEAASDLSLPAPDFLLLRSSNAHFFDRLYLSLLFFGKTRNQFKLIGYLPTEKKIDRTAFSFDKFFDSSQGYFYKKSYRNEGLTVQIIYTKSYKTAEAVSKILEGEGIRVVDLTQNKDKKPCTVLENAKNHSLSAQAVSIFFDCKLVSGSTGAYDILFTLGKKEEEWEIN